MSCVELAHSSLGDWKNIFITHLIIIIKSEVSTFPIVVIFCRGCVSEMAVLSYSVIYYKYIPGELGPCFHYWCSVYGICKWSDTLWPVGRVRLFADYTISLSSSLLWRHNEPDCVSNHQPNDCLLNRLSKKTSKLRVTGLCAGNSPETGEFPAQMASNAENVSIWWRHHDYADHWHMIRRYDKHYCRTKKLF